MNRTWTLPDVDFYVLWDDMDEGILPDPLEFLARTDDYNEFETQRLRARANLTAAPGDALDDLRGALAHPDISIRVFGRDARTPDDPQHCVRVLGVRKGPRGYVIRQLPGETLWHSTGFVVTECEATRLGPLVAEQLPATEPGRGGEIPLPPPESVHLDYEYGQSAVYDSAPRRSVDSSEFLRAAVAHTGTIQVVQNLSRFGPRGAATRLLVWRDHIDDGRYAIAADNQPRAVPADTRRLTTMIDTAIADIVQAIKDERR
ncbi:ESX secretion-associated protein EspG [Nocardia alni]|uniref:ESX secretion-associated protein EspG n=1 Tax=Nocardia alni TaxID=2815723 RepID=UPI001C244A81|nr:ESX secretion-associated protein EspG [Nocardia alni]